MSIIVAIEGQGPQMSPDTLHNRQTYYSSRLVSDQAQYYSTKMELYHNLEKTIAIWVKLSPKATERNTIIRDLRYRHSLADPDTLIPSPLNKAEIIEINIGPYDEEEKNELLGILDILFSKDMDLKEKDNNLKGKYHIALRSSILRETGKMGALAEEFELYGNECEEKGFDKGRQSEFQESLDYYTQQVYEIVINESVTPESIVEQMRLPPKYRIPVLDAVKAKISVHY